MYGSLSAISAHQAEFPLSRPSVGDVKLRLEEAVIWLYDMFLFSIPTGLLKQSLVPE